MLELLQEMIDKYPSEDEMAAIIVDNYANYIHDLRHNVSPRTQQQVNISAKLQKKKMMMMMKTKLLNFTSKYRLI